MNKQKFWIITTSIIATALVVLSGLYFTFEFIEHQQKEQHLSYNANSSVSDIANSSNTNSSLPTNPPEPTITLAQAKKMRRTI